MKDGSKEKFGCPVAIKLYNKIMRGKDITDQMANVYELDRKSRKWWKKVLFSPIDECNGQLMDCVLCELKHRITLLDFSVLLAEALWRPESSTHSINAVEELDAHPKHHESYSMLVTICQEQKSMTAHSG
ncbi:rho guanine nucleotide exchange factor 10-like protein [Trichonephila clavata]|uniref:Rho guanine nucleotide exchange factor 10-like protein n=1 Tax=Trichonephila clavata TaxID=2740835 RepID=A0A8X6G6K2_TRICU|nr:rho guanine nucleotide exchange factor 10-like protein [Trichonephila clavata]